VMSEFRRILAHARARGIFCSFDPNLRSAACPALPYTRACNAYATHSILAQTHARKRIRLTRPCGLGTDHKCGDLVIAGTWCSLLWVLCPQMIKDAATYRELLIATVSFTARIPSVPRCTPHGTGSQCPTVSHPSYPSQYRIPHSEVSRACVGSQLPLFDLIKISAEDLEFLFGHRLSADEVGRYLVVLSVPEKDCEPWTHW
jgi:hypothetical protein